MMGEKRGEREIEFEKKMMEKVFDMKKENLSSNLKLKTSLNSSFSFPRRNLASSSF